MRNIKTLSLQQVYFLKNYGQETCTFVFVLWKNIPPGTPLGKRTVYVSVKSKNAPSPNPSPGIPQAFNERITPNGGEFNVHRCPPRRKEGGGGGAFDHDHENVGVRWTQAKG